MLAGVVRWACSEAVPVQRRRRAATASAIFRVEERGYGTSPCLWLVELRHVPCALDDGQLRTRHLVVESLGHLHREAHVLRAVKDQVAAGELA